MSERQMRARRREQRLCRRLALGLGAESAVCVVLAALHGGFGLCALAAVCLLCFGVCVGRAMD